MPNMAKNVSVMPAEATLKRRSRNSSRSSIGCGVCDSRQPKAAKATADRREDAEGLGRGPAVVRALDDGVDQRRQGDDGQQRAGDVERVLLGVLRLGDEDGAGDEGQRR